MSLALSVWAPHRPGDPGENLGEQLLNMTGVLQNGGMIGDIAGSAVGGGVVMAIVGLIKNAMVKQTA
jgi:hypothetical protein